MNKKSIFEIVRSSGPLEYEYVTYEILFKSEPIVSVNLEKGIGNLEAEVFGKYRGYGTGVIVPLDDLIESLIEVRNEMERVYKK